MSKIFITGDTHCDIDIVKLEKKNFQSITGIDFNSITKDDYLIVCGDFGLIWYLDRLNQKEANMINWYENKPWTTLFIDGNHENFDRLYNYSIETWCGGKVHRISDSILHLMRGQVFTIDNKKFFTMGGATSIDKLYRQPQVSWWEQELPSRQEYSEALDNLERNNNEVDYILSHCCGTSYQEKLLDSSSWYNEDSLTKFFEIIESDVSFIHWFFGHYHLDKRIDRWHTCLYNDIIQISF